MERYQNKPCHILMEKRCKHQNMFKRMFGIVEVVNDQHLYVNDTKGSRFKIPIESIRILYIQGEK